MHYFAIFGLKPILQPVIIPSTPPTISLRVHGAYMIGPPHYSKASTMGLWQEWLLNKFSIGSSGLSKFPIGSGGLNDFPTGSNKLSQSLDVVKSLVKSPIHWQAQPTGCQ